MKRVLSMILALLMVVGTMVVMPLTATAADAEVWDGKASTYDADAYGEKGKVAGIGTFEDPYIIDEPGDFLWLGSKHSSMQALNTLGRNGKTFAAQYNTYYDWMLDGAIVAEGTEGADWMPLPVGVAKASTSKLQAVEVTRYGSATDSLTDWTTDFEGGYNYKYVNWDADLVAIHPDTAVVDYNTTMKWTEKVYIKQVCDLDFTTKDGMGEIGSMSPYWAFTDGSSVAKGSFFSAIYDGKGYSLKNLNVVRGTDKNTNWTDGLLGNMWGGTFKNVVLDNVHTTAHRSGMAIGLVAAKMLGAPDFGNSVEIANKVGESNIINVKALENCSVTSAGGASAGCGGLVGKMANGNVVSCVNLGTVTAKINVGYGFGGIVGFMYASNTTVDGCYFGGELTVAPNYTTDDSGKRTGVTTEFASETHMGGIVGTWSSGWSTSVAHEDNAITNCINNGTFLGVHYDSDYDGQDDTYFVSTAGSFCNGGILGATSNQYTGSSGSYTFAHNINLTTNTNWKQSGGRLGSIVGCSYIGANVGKNTTVQIVLEDCHTVSQYGKSHDATQHPATPLKMVGGNYTRCTACNKYSKSCTCAEGTKNLVGGIAEGNGCSVFSNTARMGGKAWFVDTMYKVFNGYLQGEGTEANPWKIGSVDDWNMFTKLLNSDNGAEEFVQYEAYNGKYLALTADIDFGGATMPSLCNYQPDNWSWGGGADNAYGQNRMNIKGTAFRGNLDGQGYALKNAIIDSRNEGGNANWPNGGIFGSIMGATLKNIVLDNITINDAAGSVGFLVGMSKACLYTYEGYEETGTNSKGAPVGNASSVQKKDAVIDPSYNLIENVIVKDNCVMTIVDTVATYDATSGKDTYNGMSRFGGIIGSAEAVTIKGCYSGAKLITSGAITGGVYDGIGGIAGVAGVAHQIIDCVGNADIEVVETEKYLPFHEWHTFGGIVGSYMNTSTTGVTATNLIKGCVNKGSFSYHVTDTATQPHAVSYGGIVGQAGGNNSKTGSTGHTFVADTKGGHTIENCYNLSSDFTYTYGALDNPSVLPVPSAAYRRTAGIVGNSWVYDPNTTTIDGVKVTDNRDACLRDQIQVINCSTVNLRDGVISTSTYAEAAYRGAIGGHTNRKIKDNGTLMSNFKITNNDETAIVATAEDAINLLNAKAKAVVVNLVNAKKALHYYAYQTRENQDGTKDIRFLYDLNTLKINGKKVKEIRFNITVIGEGVSATMTVTQDKVYRSFLNWENGSGTPLSPTLGMEYMTGLTIKNIPSDGEFTVYIDAMLVAKNPDNNEASVHREFGVTMTLKNGVPEVK